MKSINLAITDIDKALVVIIYVKFVQIYKAFYFIFNNDSSYKTKVRKTGMFFLK